MPIDDFIEILNDEINGKIRHATIGFSQGGRLTLGGVTGLGGGSGSPPGGFIGRLNQRYVTYDTTEAALTTTSADPSLVDNLNHIRSDNLHSIHDNVASEIYLIEEKEDPVSADIVVIEDSADSYNKKRVRLTNLASGATTDTSAIHDNVASEISAIANKATPTTSDLLIIEDVADANAKKMIYAGDLPFVDHTHEGVGTGGQLDWDDVWSDAVHDHSAAGEGGTFDAAILTAGASISGQVLTSDGTGGTAWEDATGSDTDEDAIHDNVASEISAVANKATPVDGDMILIEDSEDTNAKKMVYISDLPAATVSGVTGEGEEYQVTLWSDTDTIKALGTVGISGQYLQSVGVGSDPIWATITPSGVTPEALTRTNDTNVTVTLGGNPEVSLLAATSLTMGWDSQLSAARGGTGINNAGTFTNPVNSSITGGGTVALGGYTLTVPATGTAALLGTANIFTLGQTILHDDGLDMGAAGYTDADLITVNVTGAPTIYWDESESQFTHTSSIRVERFGVTSQYTELISDSSRHILRSVSPETNMKALNVWSTYVAGGTPGGAIGIYLGLGITGSENNYFAMHSTGQIGIGATLPSGAALSIDQASSIAAIPALFVDQGDISEECIKVSSDGADRDINIITVDVTGTPKIWWDESSSNVSFTTSLYVSGAVAATNHYPITDSSYVCGFTYLRWTEVNSLKGMFGASAHVGQVTIDQSSSTGAIPALFIDQGDVSEQCIKFSSDATDQDINLFTVNVTGTPTFFWDESEDMFRTNKGLYVNGGTTGSTDIVTFMGFLSGLVEVARVNIIGTIKTVGGLYVGSATGSVSAGDIYATGDVSGLTITDRTKFYSGDALKEIKKIRGNGNGELVHASLPKFARRKLGNGEDGRDLGAMVSMLTVAIQQLADKLG